MNARAYAQALYELSKKEGIRGATLVKNLVRSLTETGRLKLLPHILRELRKMEAQNRAFEPIVEVAHREDGARAVKAAKALGIETKHATINPTLIRGWRARSGSTLVDASGKRNLIELYRNITR
jgi:F0F1-type ATP synthase delta subunit